MFTLILHKFKMDNPEKLAAYGRVPKTNTDKTKTQLV